VGFCVLYHILVSTARLGAADEIPGLRPPRAELRPTFWEQHGWQIAIAIIVVTGAIALWLKWVRRPKPAIVTPPGGIARSALEMLRGRMEDTALVAEVSRIFRRYVIAAFLLPPDELTTDELQRAFRLHPKTSAEMAASIIEFLRRCDEAKFAPAPSTTALGAVGGALELLEKIEGRQKEAGTRSPVV
jgi:hypothetical protein